MPGISFRGLKYTFLEILFYKSKMPVKDSANSPEFSYVLCLGSVAGGNALDLLWTKSGRNVVPPF